MKAALCGNPNSGKTTLFNLLTGASARVGNWPGVTVEKKEGVYKGKQKITVVDLPGIYSLAPYTPEEVISRNFILDEQPDVLINIVDATNLERNLYLTTQLMETDIPVVIALNMIDALQNTRIDSEALSERLGVPVMEVSALKNKGISGLMEKVAAVKKTSANNIFKGDKLFEAIEEEYKRAEIKDACFRAIKMLEGDSLEASFNPQLAEKAKKIKDEILKDGGEDFDGDIEAFVADARYKYIEKILSGIFERGSDGCPHITKSDRIDKVLTHKIFGIPIFLAVMFAVFHLTFSENLLFLGALLPDFENPIFGSGAINSPGVILFNCFDWLMGTITEAAASGLSSAPAWLSGLLLDGLIGGVFTVLSFLPQIMVLFLFLSILEDSGYMARVAFIMDKAFRGFGLSGRAFLPLLSCFGCAVPGIMSTRTLGNEKERRLTVMLTPFFSCGAKLPIWATFAGVMFRGEYADLIVFAMYGMGIAVAIISALLLKLTIMKGGTPPFIMELPAYHLPKARNTAKRLWIKLREFLIRAGTIIAASVVIIWFLSSFNASGYTTEPSDSILGYIGRAIQIFFVPLGFGQGDYGWMFVVAAFTGLVAKELVVSTLGVFSGMEINPLEFEGEMSATPLGTLINSLTPASAFAFMAFNLLSVPCMAAVAAASGELENKKRLGQAIGFWLLTAYLTALTLYLSITWWWTIIVIAFIIALLITLFSLNQKGKIRLPKFKFKKPKIYKPSCHADCDFNCKDCGKDKFPK